MQTDQDRERGNLTSWKRNLNIASGLADIYRRTLIIPIRNRFGVEFLGSMPSFLALIMLILWSAFSHDTLMWWYCGTWLVFFIHRRVESLRLQNQTHSQYDGWPVDAMRVCKDENGAKQYVEPIGVGLAAAFAMWFYDQQGWNPNGLPHFLLCGAVMMAFVEMGKQAAWKRRIRGMQDAQIENEQMIRDFHDQYRR